MRPLGRVTDWVQRFRKPGSSFNTTVAIAVDGQGHIHIGGYAGSAGSWPDFLTIKYLKPRKNK